MRIYRYIIMCAAFFSLPIAVEAQRVTYHSEHLTAAAKKLGITAQIDTMNTGTNYVQSKGQRLEVRISDDLQVEHLGIPLFSQDQRTMQPSPVYDFLEYALLDNTFKVSQNPFVYTSLSFQKGAWKDMLSLADTTSCSLTNLEDKLYKVVWTRSGKTAVEVTFPVSYDMLAGSSRKEMEQNFVRDLRRFVGKSVVDTAFIDSTGLRLMDNGLYVRQGGSYILQVITDNAYFQKKDSLFRYVVDSKYPAESLANMVLADDPSVSECDINVRFVLYGGTIDSLLLPMKTFVRYCRSKGCHAYFGIESVNNSEIKASLFFYDKSSGYDHVVYLEAPLSGFATRDYTIEGTMYLYAPTNNVENLFYQAPIGKKKKIIYEN